MSSGCLTRSLPFSVMDLLFRLRTPPTSRLRNPRNVSSLLSCGTSEVCFSWLTPPCGSGYFSRVFNAYKSPDKDRQIGDRRLPNMSEYHVNGPSKFLPQGQQLVMLRLPRFTHCLRGSVTDRRDFYHQAACQPLNEPEQTCCLLHSRFLSLQVPEHGLLFRMDLLRFPSTVKLLEITSKVGQPNLVDFCLLPFSPCFRSLFQGDHLGVEFALRSHEVLLESYGLLGLRSRVQGHCNFPGFLSLGCPCDR